MHIRIKKDKWGFFDTNTGAIIDCKYDTAKDFIGEYAVVGSNMDASFDTGVEIVSYSGIGYTVIDSSGKTILKPIYDDIQIHDTIAFVKYHDQVGAFDLKKRKFVGINKQELPQQFQSYDFAVEIEPGYVLAFLDHKCQLFCNVNEIKGQFSNVFPLNDSLFVFCYGWKSYGVMDKSGTVVIEPKYHSIKQIAPNLISARKNSNSLGNEFTEHFDIINLSGTTPQKTCETKGVISWIGGNAFSIATGYNQYYCADLYEGIVLFLGGDKPKATIKLEYDYFGPVDNGYIKVRKDCKMGILNTYGELFIPCIYDEIQYTEGFFIVKSNYSSGCPRSGIINRKGDFTIPVADYQRIEETTTPSIVLVMKGVLGGNKEFYTLSGKRVIKNSTGHFVYMPNTKPASKERQNNVESISQIDVPQKQYGPSIAGPFVLDGHFVVSYQGHRDVNLDLSFLSANDKVFLHEVLRKLDINGDLPKQRKIDSHGRIIVSRDNEQVILANEYTYAGNWIGDYMRVLCDEKWGIMNKKMELVVSCQFEYIYGFEDSVAIGLHYDYLFKRWETFIIDLKTGNSNRINVDGCYGFWNGIAVVMKRKTIPYYGLINLKGEIILPCDYSCIPFLDEEELLALYAKEDAQAREESKDETYSRKELDELYLDAFEGDPSNFWNTE